MLKIYKRAIRTAKRSSWRSFCNDIEKTADVAKLTSVLSKQPTLCLIKSEAGHWADSNRRFREVPGCSEVDSIEPGRTMVDATDAGPDGIFPAMLQEAVHLIIPWLKKIFKECLRLNYVPKAWRIARVVFMPKACIARTTGPSV